MNKIAIASVFVVASAVVLFLAARILLAQDMTHQYGAYVIPATGDLTRENGFGAPILMDILANQEIGSVWPFNPLKFAIRNAVFSGIPINTIVLLLLLPIVASFIAAARQLVGIKGFGIFLPASLSIVFLATGPLLGIILFLIIVSLATAGRLLLKKIHLRLQYLPRMAIILWIVSFGVLGFLFLLPFSPQAFPTFSIFPILFLILLAESFIGVQIGKNANEAIAMTAETFFLALVSFILLSWKALREFVLLQPEVTLLCTLVIDWIIGRFSGLRLIEYYRFRKLIAE